jgi:fatty acid desaturase
MKFQRDSFWDFLKYSVSFLFVGIGELILYFRAKKFYQFAKKVFRGESIFILLLIALSFIHLKAVFWIFVLCTVIVRFSMMAGNWGQHAFIDAPTPDNNYRNSITCINNAYNKKCFNDGYHIGHHLRPNLHWTEMPIEFEDNQAKYAAEKAIVFEGLDFHMVWGCLMLKRYDILANHFVNLENAYSNKGEIINLLKTRTQRILT